MNKYLKISLIVIAFVIIGTTVFKFLGNSFKNLINKKFPPISYLDQQDSSLRANQRALDNIGNPDIAINIGAKDFSQLLDSSLSQFSRSNTLTIPHVKKYRFDKFETSTDKQLINLAMDFYLELDTMNASLKGKLSGVVTFAIEHDSLILLPALKTLHISDVSYNDKNKSDKNILIGFFNSTLKTFMLNINGLINSKVIGIDINLMHKKINTENLPHNDTINITLSKPLEVSMPIVIGACMIDESGVHIMGAFNYSFGATVPIIAKSFKDDFKEFRKIFFKKNETAFPDAPSIETTYFVIQKKLISSIINQTLLGDTIRGNYDKDIIPTAVDKEIVIKSSDIDCDKIDFKCPEIPMPQLPSPPSLPNCNFDCSWWQQPACGIAEAACRATEAGVIAAWKITCESILAPWRTTNLAIQAKCLEVKVPAKLSCLGIKKTIDVAGGQVDLGSVKVEANAHLKLNSELREIKLNEDLSSISFLLQTSAIVPARINFQLHSKTAGKIVCPFDVSHSIDCIGTGLINNTITSKIIFKKSDDNQMLLIFEISPFPVEAMLTPAPLEIINSTFSSSFLSCPLISQTVGGVSITLNVVKGFRDIFNGGDGSEIQNLIFDGKYKTTTPMYPVNIPIQCKPLELFGNSIMLTPLINNSYLGFSNK